MSQTTDQSFSHTPNYQQWPAHFSSLQAPTAFQIQPDILHLTPQGNGSQMPSLDAAGQWHLFHQGRSDQDAFGTIGVPDSSCGNDLDDCELGLDNLPPLEAFNWQSMDDQLWPDSYPGFQTVQTSSATLIPDLPKDVSSLGTVSPTTFQSYSNSAHDATDGFSSRESPHLGDTSSSIVAIARTSPLVAVTAAAGGSKRKRDLSSETSPKPIAKLKVIFPRFVLVSISD